MADDPRHISQAKRINRNFGRFVNLECRRKSTAVITLLIVLTPVDTYHASSSWMAVSGGPTGKIVPNTPGSAETQAARQASSISAIDRHNFWRADLTIENEAPYLNRLNEGWSDQAPAGFVDNIIDIVEDL